LKGFGAGRTPRGPLRREERDAPEGVAGTAALRRLAASCLAAALTLASAPRLDAQAHPGGRWATLETRHFRVHVRPAQESLGVRVAGEAEAAWQSLAALLPAPREAVDLVVSDQADYANAFASVFPSPRIVLYPFPPVADLELQRYDRWLRLMVTHELAHVFHLDLALGWWGVARSLLGRAPVLFPNAYAPAWLLEGLAVHYESVLTGAGRDAGSYHGAVVAAQAAEAGGLPIDAAGALSPRWPGGYRPYAFGGEFLSRLTRRHGDSVAGRLVRHTARAPLPFLSLDRSLRRAAGVSLSREWREWQAEERAAAPGVPGGAECGRARLCGLRAPVPPRVSGDGRRVLFVQDDGRDSARIAVLDRGSGAVRAVARVNGGLGLAWDVVAGPGPGGSSDPADRRRAGAVIAAEYEYTDPYTLRADLWRVDALGREVRLTRGARLLAPDVAPDGSVIAVRAVPGGNALVRWTPESTAVVVPAAPGVEWAHPRVSPDGRTVAATRSRGGSLDVVLLGSNGAFLRAVTEDAAIDQMPAFSADGRWLLWASDRDGRSQVYATRLDTTGAGWWRVTGEPFGAYAPAPAPDSVFYLGYHHDGWRLSAAPFDTLRWVPVEPKAGPAVAAGAAPEPRTPIVARHSYSAWPSLLPKYLLPLWNSYGAASWIGALTSGQDALDRHYYLASAQVGIGAARRTWRADLAYYYAGLSPAVLDAAYSRGEEPYVRRAAGAAGDSAGWEESCCIRSEDASLGVAWLLRRYRWSAAVRVGAEYERFGPVQRVGGVLSAVAGRLLRPAFAISTQQGHYFSASLRRSWRLDDGGGYSEVVSGGATYVPLGGRSFARQVLAIRAAAGSLAGGDAVLFGVGGVSGGSLPLLPGMAVGSPRRSFPARGFAPGAAVGRSAFAASLEHRIPLALVGRGLGLAPGSLDRVSAALFADLACAWSPGAWVNRFEGLRGSEALASAGAELTVDLGVLYDYPVRLRAGLAGRLRGGSGVGFHLAVGADF